MGSWKTAAKEVHFQTLKTSACDMLNHQSTVRSDSSCRYSKTRPQLENFVRSGGVLNNCGGSVRDSSSVVARLRLQRALRNIGAHYFRVSVRTCFERLPDLYFSWRRKTSPTPQVDFVADLIRNLNSMKAYVPDKL